MSNGRKAKLSAKDLKELGAAPRPRRVIPPHGPARVEGLGLRTYAGRFFVPHLTRSNESGNVTEVGERGADG